MHDIPSFFHNIEGLRSPFPPLIELHLQSISLHLKNPPNGFFSYIFNYSITYIIANYSNNKLRSCVIPKSISAKKTVTKATVNTTVIV
jgi:hypothetical protein